MSDTILTLNAGSSSLKFAIFDAPTPGVEPRIVGKIAGIGRAPHFSARDDAGTDLEPGPFADLNDTTDHGALVALLFQWLAPHVGTLASVGHRVVHGGRDFTAPTVITQTVLDSLETLIPLAPLHQPHNLAAMHAVAKWRPGLRQVACFDTSFHTTQDPLAKLFALPRALTEDGILRYGFHGLSYDYVASVLPEHLGARAEGRVIVAHLGNGSSMCALKDRQSRATSMGFTALDGLMMGSRCGALDPGVVLYLMQSRGMSAAEIEDLLYRRSGLLGVSGLSNNMQVLTQSDDPNAREAIALYCHRAANVLAGLLPTIGGMDALVFTAGIGENAALVRAMICDKLAWLGVSVDPDANDRNATRISAEGSAVDVLVLPTNEEAVVARACAETLR